MTSRRFRSGFGGALRHCASVVCFASLALAPGLFDLPAAASQLLPPNFFDSIPETQDGQAGVEADQLHYNSETGIITATGNVGLSYTGYYATADSMTFNQATRELLLEGNVHIVDPGGVEYTADRVEVSNSFKDAVLDAMVMMTKDGAMVTGSQTRKMRGDKTEVDNGTYAPCGTCIDAKGNRIGWRVRTEKMVQNTKDGYSELTQPVLEVLGYPIAWLPWIRLPDLGDGFRTPSYDYAEKIGLKVNLPYYYAINGDMGILFTPSLISKQGLLLSTEFQQSFGKLGKYSVTASGIYQLRPDDFAAGYGDTPMRGAIQTSGKFTPLDHWTVGWSYTTFTDTAFLNDYLINTSSVVTNEAYATYLTSNTYADARVQEYRLLGAVTQATQDKQALVLPRVEIDHVQELPENGGTVRLTGDFEGLARADDAVSSNAIAYRLGTEEVKTHSTGEADWSRQFVLGPSVVTPMAGLRLDYATYDGASALQPGASTLLSATPIAALDIRVPFVAYDGGATYLIEPVAQAYYRAGPTAPGITNDNAQSFAFDDSNLFSYNRFSGTDRQETGLRANLGVHYLANFSDGSYLDAVLGQTFHLAGDNDLATADAVNAGAGAGLSGAASDIVAGARIGIGSNITLSGKMRYDIAATRIAAVAANATYTNERWKLGLDYSYVAPDPARGFSGVQQDIGGSVGIPIADYWTLSAATGWDITAGKLIDYSGSLVYDDGYLRAGASVSSSGPLIYDPSTFTYKLSFKLKGPDGNGFGL